MGNKTIHLDELVPDRCNFKDKTFEGEVARFMAWAMPGFPVGLLDTEDAEKWEFLEAGARVLAVDYTISVRPADQDEPEQAVIEIDDCDEDLSDEQESAVRAFVRDYCNCPAPGEGADSDTVYLALAGEAVIGCYERERSAERALDEWREEQEEARAGFPWAHAWAHLPDEGVSTEDLQRAGFTVATYNGGDGSGYRLAGVDGGGYSFDGQHFGPLYAIWAERRGVEVETDHGRRRIVAR